MRRFAFAVATAALVMAGMQPAEAATPSRVGLVAFTKASLSSSTGLASLTIDWTDVNNASTYQIFMSRSYSMTNVRTFGSTASTKTISGLVRGADYFFQVRGVNGSNVGERSQRVGHTTIRSQGTAIGPSYRVMTYNVCAAACPNWSTREPAAMARISTYAPDVVALQEANASLVNDLPNGYTVAITKSAKQLLYKASLFDLATITDPPTTRPGDDSNNCSPTWANGRAGYVLLGYHDGKCRYAVWAELIDKVSQKHTIFVSVHTVSGDTLTSSRQRRIEITTLLTAMNAVNASKLPVVYAGDFNSHKNRADDSVADVFHNPPSGSGYHDAFDLARTLYRQHYNSYNDFQITPKISYKWGDHVDHVWVVPGKTRVAGWRNGALITNNRMVAPIPSDHSPLVIDVQVN